MGTMSTEECVDDGVGNLEWYLILLRMWIVRPKITASVLNVHAAAMSVIEDNLLDLLNDFDSKTRKGLKLTSFRSDVHKAEYCTERALGRCALEASNDRVLRAARSRLRAQAICIFADATRGG